MIVVVFSYFWIFFRFISYCWSYWSETIRI